MKTEELFDAIKKNDAAAIAALLDEDRALLGATSNDITAVLFAVYYGHPELAALFVERGAELSLAELAALGDRRALDGEIESYSTDGFPLLGLAIFFRHPELARELIARGADVNARARNQARVMPVHAATAVGDHETMRLLLARGADPNARQQLGYAPLHDAAARGDETMVGLLLDGGADPQAKNDDGKTPAEMAADKGHATLAERLRAL
ncbi:MAG: ankyrin repeat domain-containing protein [Acidobacteriota bacterium]